MSLCLGHKRIINFVATAILAVSIGFTPEHGVCSATDSDVNYSGSISSPIFIVGLPRSGALSIHSFFGCMGFTAAHYCCTQNDNNDSTPPPPPKPTFPCPAHEDTTTCGKCVHENLLRGNPAVQGCGNYQVFSSLDVESSDPFAWFLPQHFCLPLLTKDYPDARYILNTRSSSEQWATNVQHWYSVTNRLFNSFDIPYHAELEASKIGRGLPRDVTSRSVYVELERSLARSQNATEHARRKNALLEIYTNHTDRVMDYFRRRNSKALLPLTVDSTTAGSQLATFFGLDVAQAKTCWTFDPHLLDDDWKNFTLQV